MSDNGPPPPLAPVAAKKPPAPPQEVPAGALEVATEDGRIVLRMEQLTVIFSAAAAFAVGGYLRAHALALDPTIDPAPAPEVE